MGATLRATQGSLECHHHGESQGKSVAQIDDVGKLGSHRDVMHLLGPRELGERDSRIAGVPSPPGWIIFSRA